MTIRTVPRLCVLAAIVGLAGCQATEAPPVEEPDTIMTVDGNSVLRTATPGLVFGANLGAWV